MKAPARPPEPPEPLRRILRASVGTSEADAVDAELTEARMALDDGNYQKVINILEPGYDASNPDPETVRHDPRVREVYLGGAHG